MGLVTRHSSLRLRDYDYSNLGAYFVTICALDRRCPFGQVVDGEMRMNPEGQIVAETWTSLPAGIPVATDAFIVMPNHVHGIVVIEAQPSSPASARRRMTLPLAVGRLKTLSAKNINLMRRTPGIPVWQRSYYDHVIRTPEDMDRIRQYIADNPVRWQFDEENPNHRGDS